MYSKKSTLKKMSKKPVKRSKSRLNVKKRKVNSKRVTTKRKTKKSNKKNRKSQKKQLGGNPLLSDPNSRGSAEQDCKYRRKTLCPRKPTSPKCTLEALMMCNRLEQQ